MNVAAFWAEQPFDLGMDSDYGNCDLCWKKNEAKLIRTIQEDPSRVIWWSGTEERFGQVFRQDRPNYRALAWSAEGFMPLGACACMRSFRPIRSSSCLWF